MRSKYRRSFISKDENVVEFALNRTLSPALVSEYEHRIVSKKILRQKIHEWTENEEKLIEI